MSGNDVRFAGWQFALDYVQIGTANTAKVNADQYFSRTGFRSRDFGVFERIGVDRRRRA
jgi:hypothetical protein